MIKHLFIAGCFSILIFGVRYSPYPEKSTQKEGFTKTIESDTHDILNQKLSKDDTLHIPDEIIFPSSVGEVDFPHGMHIEDLEINCVECHHQINAKGLETPHPEYFKSSWINCNICHNGSGKVQKVYTCSKCHHPSPVDIADETLSSKVVIHNKCWECHEVGTGKDASESCKMCHSGEKRKSK